MARKQPGMRSLLLADRFSQELLLSGFNNKHLTLGGRKVHSRRVEVQRVETEKKVINVITRRSSIFH